MTITEPAKPAVMKEGDKKPFVVQAVVIWGAFMFGLAAGALASGQSMQAILATAGQHPEWLVAVAGAAVLHGGRAWALVKKRATDLWVYWNAPNNVAQVIEKKA